VKKCESAPADALYRADIALALFKVSREPGKTVPYLTEALIVLDLDAERAAAIAKALGEIGPAAREALPALERAGKRWQPQTA